MPVALSRYPYSEHYEAQQLNQTDVRSFTAATATVLHRFASIRRAATLSTDAESRIRQKSTSSTSDCVLSGDMPEWALVHAVCTGSVDELAGYIHTPSAQDAAEHIPAPPPSSSSPTRPVRSRWRKRRSTASHATTASVSPAPAPAMERVEQSVGRRTQALAIGEAHDQINRVSQLERRITDTFCMAASLAHITATQPGISEANDTLLASAFWAEVTAPEFIFKALSLPQDLPSLAKDIVTPPIFGKLGDAHPGAIPVASTSTSTSRRRSHMAHDPVTEAAKAVFLSARGADTNAAGAGAAHSSSSFHYSRILTQFTLGLPATGTPIHIHNSAWNALFAGRKLWVMLRPPHGELSVRHPFQRRLPGDREMGSVTEGGKELRCVQEAGDMVYVPERWGHGVVNLAASIAVAEEFDMSMV